MWISKKDLIFDYAISNHPSLYYSRYMFIFEEYVLHFSYLSIIIKLSIRYDIYVFGTGYFYDYISKTTRITPMKYIV